MANQKAENMENQKGEREKQKTLQGSIPRQVLEAEYYAC
jgi:hypothetical protein